MHNVSKQYKTNCTRIESNNNGTIPSGLKSDLSSSCACYAIVLHHLFICDESSCSSIQSGVIKFTFHNQPTRGVFLAQQKLRAIHQIGICVNKICMKPTHSIWDAALHWDDVSTFVCSWQLSYVVHLFSRAHYNSMRFLLSIRYSSVQVAPLHFRATNTLQWG